MVTGPQVASTRPDKRASKSNSLPSLPSSPFLPPLPSLPYYLPFLTYISCPVEPSFLLGPPYLPSFPSLRSGVKTWTGCPFGRGVLRTIGASSLRMCSRMRRRAVLDGLCCCRLRTQEHEGGSVGGQSVGSMTPKKLQSAPP